MDKYLQRKAIKVGNNILNLGYYTIIELEMHLDCLERKVFDISQLKMRSDTKHNSEIAAAIFNQLEEKTPSC